jgi:hypothetical protein
LTDLNSAGGSLNSEVALRLRGQISVAEITGINEIDVEAAVVQALVQCGPKSTPNIPLPTHREPAQAQILAVEAEVDDSIDYLVDMVIDLR